MSNNYENFTDAYGDLVQEVSQEYEHECSPRGMMIREKLGVRFSITDPRARLPFIPSRNFSISYVVAEALWYMAGLNSVDWISNYSNIWSNVSDDGTTANSAYGSRIFKPHERIASNLDPNWTQWQYVIDELVRDPDSRRAVIHIRSPQDSIQAHKDVPCTLTLQFFLRSRKLYQVVSMRSSDVIWGIGNDIPAFTLFQELLTLELEERLGYHIELGDYVHISNSMHLYQKHWELADQMVHDYHNFTGAGAMSMPRMPSKPPLAGMLAFEKTLRQMTNPVAIKAQLQNHGWAPYWDDWMKILISHRLGKLGDKEGQQLAIKSTSWPGYHFFTR